MSKINFGIDLGTTNSSIATLKDGVPFIFQSDLREDVIPSCVSFTASRTVNVGTPALNDHASALRAAVQNHDQNTPNSFVEFKRTMGTDAGYYSSNMDQTYKSDELSAEVLKKLRSFVTGDQVKQVIITVPAKFVANQKMATIEAAKKAGFANCQLLQEPIAASFAYGLSSEEKNGVWLVFDFGGGTFDAALVHNDSGVMQVFDTEGDSYLGGKDLDFAIVDELMLPYIYENYTIYDRDDGDSSNEKKAALRNALKLYAEDVRKKLSTEEKVEVLTDLGDLGVDDEGEEIELDMTLTRDEVFEVIGAYYDRAVKMCEDLLERNDIRKEKLSRVILVGGPTFCPLVRDKLREKICSTVDTSINPMTAVAAGAALYASTVDALELEEDRKEGSVHFDFSYESTTVAESEWVSFRCLEPEKIKSGINLEFVRGDGAWSSGRINAAGQDGDVAEFFLVKDRANVFTVRGFDDSGNSVDIYPNEISIINGTRVSKAVLPYNICFAREIREEVNGTVHGVALFGGLKKNVPLPTVGVSSDSKVSSIFKSPGDRIYIPIYQADFAMHEDDNCMMYPQVGSIDINYEDVGVELPFGTPVTLKLKIDTSERMEIEAYFPSVDKTVIKPVTIDAEVSEGSLRSDIADFFSQVTYYQRKFQQMKLRTPKFNKLVDEAKEAERDSSLEPGAVLQKFRNAIREGESIRIKNENLYLKLDLHNVCALLAELEPEFFDMYCNDLLVDGEPLCYLDVGDIPEENMEKLHSKYVKFGHMLSTVMHTISFFDNKTKHGTDFSLFDQPEQLAKLYSKVKDLVGTRNEPLPGHFFEVADLIESMDSFVPLHMYDDQCFMLGAKGTDGMLEL